MAITNNERVGKALDLLKAGAAPYVERELVARYQGDALAAAQSFVPNDRLNTGKAIKDWDSAAILALMWNSWNDVFARTLGHAERSYVSELRGTRTRWAHQEVFSGDDTYRALVADINDKGTWSFAGLSPLTVAPTPCAPMKLAATGP